MSTPTGPAGGDLNGTYPNPGVTGLAAVIAESAGNTADITTINGEISTINTEIAPLLTIAKGSAAMDITGQAVFFAGIAVSVVMVSWNDPTAIGVLSVVNTGLGYWRAASTAGGADDGKAFTFLGF